MNSKERHEVRYQRRKQKRLKNRLDRCLAIGIFDEVFSLRNLYMYSTEICKGIRWKRSVQDFEQHRLSRTVATYLALQRFERNDRLSYKPKKYKRFTLCERGKTRIIDAPYIDDKLVQKTLCREVLHKLYPPIIAFNNGASQEGKGTFFSRQQLRDDLRYHFRKYGKSGSIILIDFKDFFPSAAHWVIKQRHKDYILDKDICRLADLFVDSAPNPNLGMPLGIEPSQYEMIAFSSALDHYITCQLGIKGFGRYMDDYYIIVPPDKDAKEILDKIVAKYQMLGLRSSPHKTKIVPFGQPFRYCKVKYIISDTGKIITRGYRKNIRRSRRKLQTFAKWYKEGKMSVKDLYSSIQSSLAYFKQTNNHKDKLKYCRLFYSLFGFSCEERRNFAF